jgi:hypothetical protein
MNNWHSLSLSLIQSAVNSSRHSPNHQWLWPEFTQWFIRTIIRQVISFSEDYPLSYWFKEPFAQTPASLTSIHSVIDSNKHSPNHHFLWRLPTQLLIQTFSQSPSSLNIVNHTLSLDKPEDGSSTFTVLFLRSVSQSNKFLTPGQKYLLIAR